MMEMKAPTAKKLSGLFAFILLSQLNTDAFAEKKTHKPGAAAKVLGVTTQAKQPHTQEQADLAHEIGKDVVCLCGTCPKRTISSCECGWAVQNQNGLLNAVVAGHTKEKIISAYRSAYGDQVLSLLPNEGFAVTAWALPYAVAGFAFIVILFLGFRFVSKPSTITALTEESTEAIPEVTDDGEARAALARELEDLD
jgi:cytochrome c-type biogenesis protein CcmH/NrfF